MYPFQHDLAFFLTLFLINYIPDLCIFIVPGPPDYIFYFAFYSYITTYVIVLISNINLFIGKIVKPIILAGYIIFALVNLYCIIFLHCRLSHDIIQIIIGTNFVEVIEYFETYINYKLILGGGIITAIIIIFFVFMKRMRLNSYSSKISFCMFGFLLLSWIVVENLNSAIKKDLSYGWLFNVDDIIDVKMHPTNPKLEFNGGNSSSNIIVIFGESFAPSHSSLYGYDKITNPLLNKKLEEKDLILFTNVKSPAAGTNRAFMYILNTKLLEDDDSIKWYKFPNLIEVLSASGYKAYWFSTQKEKRMYHNLSSGFSRICDEAHFTSNHK